MTTQDTGATGGYGSPIRAEPLRILRIRANSARYARATREFLVHVYALARAYAFYPYRPYPKYPKGFGVDLPVAATVSTRSKAPA